MKGFDPKVPMRLQMIQSWFANITTHPINPQNALPKRYAPGANRFIAQSPTLEPLKRIELYHRQYWWRLLGILHENFPLLTLILGHSRFNRKIGIPYLKAHPPTHWALYQLGDTLSDWIHKDYTGNDKSLLTDGAAIDFAAQKAFWRGSFEKTSLQTTPLELLHAKVDLHPSITLFALPYDLFAFRSSFLSTQKRPPLTHTNTHAIVYRSLDNHVNWKELSLGEFSILSWIQSGHSIYEACQKLEDEAGLAYTEASALLPLWIKHWLSFNWLSLSNNLNF